MFMKADELKKLAKLKAMVKSWTIKKSTYNLVKIFFFFFLRYLKSFECLDIIIKIKRMEKIKIIWFDTNKIKRINLFQARKTMKNNHKLSINPILFGTFD